MHQELKLFVQLQVTFFESSYCCTYNNTHSTASENESLAGLIAKLFSLKSAYSAFVPNQSTVKYPKTSPPTLNLVTLSPTFTTTPAPSFPIFYFILFYLY